MKALLDKYLAGIGPDTWVLKALLKLSFINKPPFPQ